APELWKNNPPDFPPMRTHPRHIRICSPNRQRARGERLFGLPLPLAGGRERNLRERVRVVDFSPSPASGANAPSASSPRLGFARRARGGFLASGILFLSSEPHSLRSRGEGMLSCLLVCGKKKTPSRVTGTGVGRLRGGREARGLRAS